IVRSIAGGIITTDQEDRITFVNTAACRLLRRQLTDLVAIPLNKVFPLLCDEAAGSGQMGDKYLTILEVEGERLYLEVSVSDLKDEQGVPNGRLVIFQDVTQFKKMEERVRLSERQAAFVRIAAGMAHEIRNPLAALRGASELIAQSECGAAHEEQLTRIVVREADRINNLVGDFVATVHADLPHRERIMLDDLVKETVDLFSLDKKSTGHVTVETLLNKGVEVEGDADRLKQAIRHLLTNARDATPNGKRIKVLLENKETEGEVRLQVRDSGEGIPMDMKYRLFEPFATSKANGTGLGLAVVLSVVEEHNGTIEVEDAPGIGTVFTVRLPLAPPQEGTGSGERG
ncbi:MAG: ATP-binding protein, partial [Pseudomonadota bacterium]